MCLHRLIVCQQTARNFEPEFRSISMLKFWKRLIWTAIITNHRTQMQRVIELVPTPPIHCYRDVLSIHYESLHIYFSLDRGFFHPIH